MTKPELTQDYLAQVRAEYDPENKAAMAVDMSILRRVAERPAELACSEQEVDQIARQWLWEHRHEIKRPLSYEEVVAMIRRGEMMFMGIPVRAI